MSNRPAPLHYSSVYGDYVKLEHFNNSTKRNLGMHRVEINDLIYSLSPDAQDENQTPPPQVHIDRQGHTNYTLEVFFQNFSDL